MIQDITQIPGFPEVMNHILAVSDIHDLSFKDESKLCFTISFKNNTFVNVYQPFTETDRCLRFREINLLHDHVLEYLEKVRQTRRNNLFEESDTVVSGK